MTMMTMVPHGVIEIIRMKRYLFILVLALQAVCLYLTNSNPLVLFSALTYKCIILLNNRCIKISLIALMRTHLSGTIMGFYPQNQQLHEELHMMNYSIVHFA